MKWKSTGGLLFALGLGVAIPALHAESSAKVDMASAAKAFPQERGIDWVQHTQQTLAELRAKLNLLPAQTAAWDAWSEGMIKDAQENVAQAETLHEKGGDGERSATELTTPEQMQHGIERLKVRLQWMQDHLSQLEAAQARTKTFYDRLDVNQKTIFDLFWHEMYYRMAEQGFAPDMRRGYMHHGFGPADAGMCPMHPNTCRAD